MEMIQLNVKKFQEIKDDRDEIFILNKKKFESIDEVKDFFEYKFFIELGYTLIEWYIKKIIINIKNYDNYVAYETNYKRKNKMKIEEHLKRKVLNVFPEQYNIITNRNDIIHNNYIEKPYLFEKIKQYISNPKSINIHKITNYLTKIEYLYKMSFMYNDIELFFKNMNIFIVKQQILEEKLIKIFTKNSRQLNNMLIPLSQVIEKQRKVQKPLLKAMEIQRDFQKPLLKAMEIQRDLQKPLLKAMEIQRGLQKPLLKAMEIQRDFQKPVEQVKEINDSYKKK